MPTEYEYAEPMHNISKHRVLPTEKSIFLRGEIYLYYLHYLISVILPPHSKPESEGPL